MRKIIWVFLLLLFIFAPETSRASGSNFEFEWDYLNSHFKDRSIDTSNLHILKKYSQKGKITLYRGVTVTRPTGSIFWENETRDSSALGIGPVFLARYEKSLSPKLSAALDASGGLIFYNKNFPPGGYFYNFMWRAGPRLIYKINETTSFSAGYMLMHVSNAMKTSRNPSYNAVGASFSLAVRF